MLVDCKMLCVMFVLKETSKTYKPEDDVYARVLVDFQNQRARVDIRRPPAYYHSYEIALYFNRAGLFPVVAERAGGHGPAFQKYPFRLPLLLWNPPNTPFRVRKIQNSVP